MTELSEESEAKINSLLAEKAEADEKIESLESAVKEAEELAVQSEEKIADLEEQVEKLTEEEASVEEKVSETLSEIGVEPASIGAVEDTVDYVAEFKAISDPSEKTSFYRQHKDKILGGNN